MLLERVLERNPALVEAAVRLHQDGEVPAGSWLFDLDAIDANARAIATEARRLGLHTYLMTKQMARNPFVAAVALNAGLEKTVAVDMRCARLLHRYRIPVGHIGHLNQIPMHEVRTALEMQPDYVTVYSVEAARQGVHGGAGGRPVAGSAAAGLRARGRLLPRPGGWLPHHGGARRRPRDRRPAGRDPRRRHLVPGARVRLQRRERDRVHPQHAHHRAGSGADPGGARPARGHDQRSR